MTTTDTAPTIDDRTGTSLCINRHPDIDGLAITCQRPEGHPGMHAMAYTFMPQPPRIDGDGPQEATLVWPRPEQGVDDLSPVSITLTPPGDGTHHVPFYEHRTDLDMAVRDTVRFGQRVEYPGNDPVLAPAMRNPERHESDNGRVFAYWQLTRMPRPFEVNRSLGSGAFDVERLFGMLEVGRVYECNIRADFDGELAVHVPMTGGNAYMQPSAFTPVSAPEAEDADDVEDDDRFVVNEEDLTIVESPEPHTAPLPDPLPIDQWGPGTLIRRATSDVVWRMTTRRDEYGRASMTSTNSGRAMYWEHVDADDWVHVPSPSAGAVTGNLVRLTATGAARINQTTRPAPDASTEDMAGMRNDVNRPPSNFEAMPAVVSREIRDTRPEAGAVFTIIDSSPAIGQFVLTTDALSGVEDRVKWTIRDFNDSIIPSEALWSVLDDDEVAAHEAEVERAEQEPEETTDALSEAAAHRSRVRQELAKIGLTRDQIVYRAPTLPDGFGWSMPSSLRSNYWLRDVVGELRVCDDRLPYIVPSSGHIYVAVRDTNSRVFWLPRAGVLELNDYVMPRAVERAKDHAIGGAQPHPTTPWRVSVEIDIPMMSRMGTPCYGGVGNFVRNALRDRIVKGDGGQGYIPKAENSTEEDARTNAQILEALSVRVANIERQPTE